MNAMNDSVNLFVEATLPAYGASAPQPTAAYQPAYVSEPKLIYSLQLASAINSNPHGIVELGSPLSD
jgi:hypothetical protein